LWVDNNAHAEIEDLYDSFDPIDWYLMTKEISSWPAPGFEAPAFLDFSHASSISRVEGMFPSDLEVK
jgi:hypothetical protein